MSRRDKDDPNPKDDGKRDVGRDGDTGKRTGDKIDPNSGRTGSTGATGMTATTSDNVDQ